MATSNRGSKVTLLTRLGYGLGVLALVYAIACLSLAGWQRYFIFRPRVQMSLQPNAAAFRLPYEDVWIPVGDGNEQLHGWWLPASKTAVVLPDEPVAVFKSPHVFLYLCGVGRNMGDYNYLARASGLHQLGAAVLMLDYRGYGRSGGQFPSETQVYGDSAAAWSYLTLQRRIPSKQILIYGESLGGAIALNLAIKHPEADGLIMQSSFTSMAAVVKQTGWFRLFPIEQLLNQRFDSLDKDALAQVARFTYSWHRRSDRAVSHESATLRRRATPQTAIACARG